jgi:Fe-S-cluster containining protein
MSVDGPHPRELDSIFSDCRQCGTCCKSYRKIPLTPDEAEFIKKMGGHVGIDIPLNSLRNNTMDELVAREKEKGRVFMVHPDDKGCVFLKKVNNRHVCGIYHYRPSVCRNFRCNLADHSFLEILALDGEILL